MLFGEERAAVADDERSPVFSLRETTPEIRRLFLHALARFAVAGAFYVPPGEARALAGVASSFSDAGIVFAAIEVGERVLGVVAVACDAPGEGLFAELRSYADAVARVVGARQQISTSRRESRDSRVLATVDERMRRAPDTADLYQTVVEAVREGFSAERCAIFERQPDSTRARTLASDGGTHRLPDEVRLRFEPGSIARALETRRAFAVPLPRDARGEALLAVGFAEGADDDGVGPALRAVAAHVGLALANTQLYERERARRSRAEALERVVRVLRDAQTLDEVLRLFVVAVARELPLECTAYARDDAGFAGLAPFVSADEPTESSLLPRALRERIFGERTGALLPLHVGGSPWGALALVENAGAIGWPADERATFFRMLGSHLELALANARAFDREQRRAQERATLAEAARTILSFTTLRPLAGAMCRLAANLVGAPRACAARASAGGFEAIGVWGEGGEELCARFASRRKRLAGAADERIAGDRRRVRVAEGDGYVAVPLARTSGETGEPEAVEAYLIVGTPGERFGRDDLRLLQEMGALFALALRNLDLYEETARANAALRESSEFKDDLIAMLAHDFKGPLTVVLGYCELLLESSDVSSDEVEMIFAQTQRLVRLSEDALVLAQTQAGGFSLDRTIVDFGAFAGECIESAGPAVARVRLTLPAESLAVSLDPQRFRHVIDNLLSNALKYSEGPVDASVRREGDRAVFEVSDRGIGIPAEELQAVFTRFGRATNARLKGIAGTGVGLYVSRKIVDVHRGTLSVESRLDSGSTFTVALPLASSAGIQTSVGT